MYVVLGIVGTWKYGKAQHGNLEHGNLNTCASTTWSLDDNLIQSIEEKWIFKNVKNIGN